MAEDCFAELGLAPGLTWSEQEVQEHYDRRCQEAHPDSGGDPGAFQELQRALAVLRSPGQRLKHWLALGGGDLEQGGGELEEAVTQLFGELGPLLNRAEGLVKRLTEARSALARSLAEREAMAVMVELQAAREGVTGELERLQGRFADFERLGASGLGDEGGRTVRSLLFLEKWERQLRARWAELAG